MKTRDLEALKLESRSGTINGKYIDPTPMSLILTYVVNYPE